MAFSIIMPKAGMAMEEGTIVKWFKKEGDMVNMGEPLLEILTDKVNMEVEATASGTLIKILKDEGDIVPVTQIIGYIGSMGEIIEGTIMQQDPEPDKNISAAEGKNTTVKDSIETVGVYVGADADGKIAATPLAKTIARENGIELKNIKPTGSRGEIKARDVEALSINNITPLAKRIAQDIGIDLSGVKGSGYEGKIRKSDIVASNVAPSTNVASSVSVVADNLNASEVKTVEVSVGQVGNVTRKPLRGMRKIIGDRMLKSHIEAPPVTLNIKADVTRLSLIRSELNEALGVKVSYNDFIMKAVGLALKDSPNINVSIEGSDVLYKEDINVGMAVALSEGLIVPVIKNINRLSVREIALKSKELSQKARDGKLLLDDYTGGTFTVSNLGMYDIVSFTPIINPPESGILGVCVVEEELKMIGDKIEKRSMMGLSFTHDHRVIDGAQGAVFLKKIKSLLENPLLILAQ